MPGISGISTTAGPEPATYTVFVTPAISTDRREKSVIGSSRRVAPSPCPLSALMGAAWPGERAYGERRDRRMSGRSRHEEGGAA
ncbi:hypothetical protein GCM10009801_17230 [Streptomyces albiaxialis]|uniref:Uncharacterized protein n=1 Tax=Streptomyces albiaxialis TaxID=329523 RepID=A0ABN2VPK2_9ACTN